MSGQFTVRKVDLRIMGNLIRILAESPGIGYAELFNRSQKLGLKSQSRLFHYLSTGRCLQLMHSFKGHYAASELGKKFAAGLENSSTPIDVARVIESGLTRCPPIRKVLKAMTPRGADSSLQVVIEKGEVLKVVAKGRNELQLRDLSNRPKLSATSLTEVNEVRWGSLAILTDLGVLSWLHLATEKDISGRYVFPVSAERDPRDWDAALHDTLRSLGAANRWVSIARVLYEMMIGYRSEPVRTKEMLKNLGEQQPSLFQLSESSRVLLNDDGYVDFRGSPRSHIRLGEAE